MKVIIMSCDKNSWYKDKIGATFYITKEDKGNYYTRKAEKDKLILIPIKKEHAEVIG